MKIRFTLLLTLLYSSILSQTCSCLDDYYFIKNHIEKNHGGFNKKIKSPDEPAYKKFTDELNKEIKALKDNRHCIAYLKKYILYLQDHHSNITGAAGQPVNESSAAAIDSFLKSRVFLSTEIVRMDNDFLSDRLKNPADGIEGIYETADGTYKVTLLENKTAYRDYAAFILESKTPLWTCGQVKFELKKINDSVMQYFGFLRNHTLNYDEIPFKKDQFRITGWEKQTNKTDVKATVIDNQLIRFTVLDSQTTLISIRSFSSAVYKTLDSVYKQIIPQIKKYPYLIIDVRNNGGGADFAYSPLMPLLYTDTIHNDVVEIYNSPDNRKAYKKFDSLSVQSGNKAVFSRSLNVMNKGDSYSFIPLGTGMPSVSVFPVNSGYPKKIAILYNRGCASSCESLLFDALYSKKTIFVGENSGGYTGYGDVMNIQTPCGNTLSWTTTVYRDQWKYEFVGIPPQYKIPADEADWIDYTRRLLHR